MSDWTKTLKTNPISMICFAEYNCYIHCGDFGNIRIESEAWVKIGDESFSLFPRTDNSALEAVLGKEILSIDQQRECLRISTDNGAVLEITVQGGNESILITVGDDTVVL